MVLMDIVSKALLADAPILDPSIDGLMPSSGNVHGIVMIDVDGIPRSKDTVVTSIASISDDFLPRTELLLQLVSKNLEIRPLPALKGTSNRYNLGSFNTDSNLIAQPGCSKLVGIPLSIKGKGLFDQEVDPIDGNKAALSTMALKSIIPLDL